MDPIHPIRPETEHPGRVDPIRHVARAGDEPPSEQQSPRGRRRRAAEPSPPAGVSADGHLDVRA
jgi:hypothetical protein